MEMDWYQRRLKWLFWHVSSFQTSYFGDPFQVVLNTGSDLEVNSLPGIQLCEILADKICDPD